MSERPSQPINRIPQIVFLIAAAALVTFLFLIRTETIELAGPTIMIVAGVLFTIGLIATAFEFELNRTGLDKPQDDNNDVSA